MRSIKIENVKPRVQFATLNAAGDRVRATVAKRGAIYVLTVATSASKSTSTEFKAGHRLPVDYAITADDLGYRTCGGDALAGTKGQCDLPLVGGRGSALYCPTCWAAHRKADRIRKAERRASGEVAVVESAKERSARLRREAGEAKAIALMARLEARGLLLSQQPAASA